MFFRPPEVKSLSQYSEFGSHLHETDFVIMVGLAALLHLIIMGIYSMTPREQPLIIPVRVLNIKLNAGSAEVDMPKESTMPGAKAEAQEEQGDKAVPQRSLQVTANKIYSANKHKPLASILAQDREKRTNEKSLENILSNAQLLAKPKKYVRESDLARKGQGNGTSMSGSKYGLEIVRNYEQEISLWMAKHKTYPEAARQQKIEGNAVVRIRINRDGHIIYSAIDTSSGNGMIDEAALAMVRDSDPVPHVPDNYPEGSELEFLIPVSFRLK